MRISDWSSDVCSSDLRVQREPLEQRLQLDQHVLGEGVDRLAGAVEREHDDAVLALLGLPVAEAQSVEPCNHGNGPLTCLGARYHPDDVRSASNRRLKRPSRAGRSEEHTSQLQSLMRISYAVFCLKKKTQRNKQKIKH